MDKEMRKMIAKRAAKYFKSGDTVNLGIGIPSLCCDYAEPGVMFQSENGFVGVGEIARGISISERLYNAGGVPYIPVLGGAALTSEMSFGMIRSGRMDATVLGGLQVSEKGDLSNWSTPGREFGMGGAMDLDERREACNCNDGALHEGRHAKDRERMYPALYRTSLRRSHNYRAVRH